MGTNLSESSGLRNTFERGERRSAKLSGDELNQSKEIIHQTWSTSVFSMDFAPDGVFPSR
jgi:hypothetical protein